MKKLLMVVLALTIVASTITGCSQPATSSNTGNGSKNDIIKIGGIFNLTGTQASLDTPTKKAAQLAVNEINAKGGINGKQVKFVVEDGKSDQTAATNATEKLISSSKINVLTGLSDSTFVLVTGAIAQKNNVPFVECGGTMPELPDQIGDTLYMACFGDNVQAYAGAEFAYNDIKAKTAWLFVDTAQDYCVTLGKYYKERFTKLAGPNSILLEDTYQTSDIDFRAQISRLKALKPQPEVLFVTADPSKTGMVTKQIREMGIMTPIVGGDGYDTPLLTEMGGTSADNLYFTTHVSLTADNQKVKDFIAAYKKEYGTDPESAFAALGYDSIYLIADAITRANSIDPNAIKKALSETKGLKGVTGSITYSEGSRVPKKSVTIMQVMKGKVSFLKEVLPK